MNGAMFRALVFADSRSLLRDPLLGWVLGLPIGLALLFRPLIPRFHEALRVGLAFDLEPSYPLVMVAT